MLQSPGQGKLKQEDVEPGFTSATGAGQVSTQRQTHEKFSAKLKSIFFELL